MIKHKTSVSTLRTYYKSAEKLGFPYWVSKILDAINKNESYYTIEDICYVDQDLILEAYNDSKICQSIKDQMKADFPEAIKEKEEYYKFENQPIKIPPCGYSLSEIPFRIAESWSLHDNEQRYTSLYMDTRYWEIETSKSQVDEVLLRIRFKKKTPPKP